MKILEITWIDAAGADGWELLKNVADEKLPLITSIGYLVADRKDSLTITMAHDVANSNAGAWMIIPKVNIKRRRVLK